MPIDNEKLIELMVKNKLNQSNLSKKAKISNSQLTRVLKGDCKPRIDTVAKIAEALNVNYKELIKWLTAVKNIF